MAHPGYSMEYSVTRRPFWRIRIASALLRLIMSPLIKQLLLPPAFLIFTLLGGLLLARRRWSAGWWIAMASACLLYLLATPLGAGALSSILEKYPPLSMGALPTGQAQAIVILGSDSVYAAEFGGETVGPLTLARLRYGARLHARTGLPILVSGGVLDKSKISLAEQMRAVLDADYGISGSWVETQSRDTWENAVNSIAILRAKDIQRIYLVTHARDMMRALGAFRRSEFDAIPAPIAFEERRFDGLRSLSPSAKSLVASYYALYELAGNVEYTWRHRFESGNRVPRSADIADDMRPQ